MKFEQVLVDESATVAFGTQLAQGIGTLTAQQRSAGVTIYLNGDLGAGKTTLTRGIVTGFGHQGRVKSPTYTLVEPYELDKCTIYHFDLYRLSDPEELEFMGVRDYFSQGVVCVVEWPQRGEGVLPSADLLVELVYVGEQRRIKLVSNSALGEDLVSWLCGFIT